MTEHQLWDYFDQAQPIFLPYEVSVVYVGWLLHNKGSFHPTGMIEFLDQHTGIKLSDTILYRALGWLEKEKKISWKWEKQPGVGRGRPRKVYSVSPEELAFFIRCASTFQAWVSDQGVDVAKLWASDQVA